MSLIKCKECGNSVSSKAEQCPKCGFVINKKSSGCIVGFFKLIGGLIGGAIGLIAITAYISSNSKVDPISELEAKCRSFSESMQSTEEKQSAYSSCVSAGKASLKAHGIN